MIIYIYCWEILWLHKLNWIELNCSPSSLLFIYFFSTLNIFIRIVKHILLLSTEIKMICLDWFPFFIRFGVNHSPCTMCNRLNISCNPVLNWDAHRTLWHYVCTMLVFSFGWFFEIAIFFIMLFCFTH